MIEQVREGIPALAPATGYVTAVWVLNTAADDRDRTAAKLRDWADEERPEERRSPALVEVLATLWSEANELRAAADVLKSHTNEVTDRLGGGSVQ